ncbi:MAG: UvrD-helicase domain-containing protein, partial [Desulfatitalea sp.]|nr:UvrD-helicase domain-containing protein [Desulfatitalea sp.]
PLTAIAPWRRAAQQVRHAWPQARETVTELLAHEGLNATKYGKCTPDPSSPRRQFVAALAAAMDRWNGIYPLFPKFERFCQSYLASATKKGHVPPGHPFFEVCEQTLTCRNALAAQLTDYVRYLKVRLLDQAHQRLAQKKARDNTLFFDDLLLQVHAALQNERRQALAQAIGKQYHAALVDEFQDTDALQYDIFATLFAGHALFFMIGDPKQAIYSFRGADLFSYLHAREKARNRYTLTRNWRATPALIQALNTLFGSRANPFGYEQIPYEKALAGRDDPAPPAAPFRLWYLARREEDDIQRPLSQEAATERIVEAVADEVVRVLDEPWPELAPVKQRLLSRPEGERRVTNVLHLAELLHQASVEQQLGPEGLLKWLARQRADGGEGEDAQKLRLESDAHAVRIITIHKSKGLQFKVVFCPFTWAGVKRDETSATFHDPQSRDCLTLAIGPDIDPAHQQLALEEALAENLRLMYVALTRARQRCYLVWGCIKGSELSAPAYLLHGPQAAGGSGDWTHPLQSTMAAMTDARLIAELQALADSSEGTIALSALPEGGRLQYRPRMTDTGAVSHRRFERRLSRPWRIASFSSMIAALPPEADGDVPDRDGAVRPVDIDLLLPGDVGDLFAFPKGAKAGIFFHDLLEHWDFSTHPSAQNNPLVAAKLQAHGFEAHWQRAVEAMLARLGQAPLPVGEGESRFCLAQVPADLRINEMEFYFPLQSITGEKLKQCFKEMGGAFFEEIASRPLERLTFAPMEGFLKGYIDTLFEYNGRFYLLDWKSNHLGNAWADYASPRLAGAMAEEYYFLQYHLYALAL